MTAPKVHDELDGHTAGQLVTIADTPYVVIEQQGPWVEVVPENGDCGFVEHESRVSRR